MARDKLATTGGAQGPGAERQEGGGQEPAAPGGSSPDAGKGPVLPEHLDWVKDPEKLSGFLADFNRKNPLNPSTSPKAVKDVYDSMKPPARHYVPPTGENKDAAEYWARYFGFSDQYAANKVSAESKDKAGAWVPGTHAAGLMQVRPIAAEDLGFNFGERKGGNLKEPDKAQAYKNALGDPNFGSLLGMMSARKSFNTSGGDPFRAEEGYVQGPYGIKRGDPWSSHTKQYVRDMFPYQWDGKTK